MSYPNTWHAPYRYERGSIPAEYGRLRFVGDRPVCHLCGKDFNMLGVHIFGMHGMTADQYREEFGLNRHTPLFSDTARRVISDRAKRRVRDGTAPIRPLTAEEMREIGKKANIPKPRMEEVLTRGGWRKPNPVTVCPKGHEKAFDGRRMFCQQCHREAGRVSTRRKRHGDLIGPLVPRIIALSRHEGEPCPNGHPWDGHRKPNGRLSCKRCAVEATQRYRAKKKLELEAK